MCRQSATARATVAQVRTAPDQPSRIYGWHVSCIYGKAMTPPRQLKRTATITLRVTPEEKAEWQCFADETGQTLTAWMTALVDQAQAKRRMRDRLRDEASE